MKRFFLILTFAAMAGAIGWLLARPNPHVKEMASLEAQLTKAKATIQTLKSELASIPPPSNQIASTQDSPNPATSTDPTATDVQSSKPTKPGNAFRDMMKAPGMKEVIIQQQRSQLGIQYGGLIEQFDLDDEERAHFEELLLKKQTEQMELGLKMMEEGVTPEDRKRLAAELQQTQKETDEAIRQFLNDDEDWKTYQDWEDSKPERTQLQMFGKSLFDTSDQPLSPDQESLLIQSMTRARKAPSPPGEPTMPSSNSFEAVSAENVGRLMASQKAKNELVLQEAASFMSPEQIETLKRFQEQQMTMTETGLKMSSMFFESQGTE